MKSSREVSRPHSPYGKATKEERFRGQPVWHKYSKNRLSISTSIRPERERYLGLTSRPIGPQSQAIPQYCCPSFTPISRPQKARTRNKDCDQYWRLYTLHSREATSLWREMPPSRCVQLWSEAESRIVGWFDSNTMVEGGARSTRILQRNLI